MILSIVSHKAIHQNPPREPHWTKYFPVSKIMIFSVYFIPAVRIFLDRQMSDIKGIYAVTFLAVSVEVCYVLLPILKQVYIMY